MLIEIFLLRSWIFFFFRSILSLNEECCEVIVDNDSLHTLLQICKKYPGREDIIVRIMYVLGNTVANSERARFQVNFPLINYLFLLLNAYTMYRFKLLSAIFIYAVIYQSRKHAGSNPKFASVLRWSWSEGVFGKYVQQVPFAICRGRFCKGEDMQILLNYKKVDKNNMRKLSMTWYKKLLSYGVLPR